MDEKNGLEAYTFRDYRADWLRGALEMPRSERESVGRTFHFVAAVAGVLAALCLVLLVVSAVGLAWLESMQDEPRAVRVLNVSGEVETILMLSK